MGDGGGGSSTSRPLNAQERGDAFDAGISRIMGNYQNPAFGQYQAQTYQGLGNGDYNALENSIYQSRTAPLMRQQALDDRKLQQSLADRGIYSSGLAVRSSNDLAERYAPQYAAAAGDAATQRYNLQAADMAARNAFNQSEATNQLNSQYRPLDYLQGLYNGTGGVISSSSSSGGWSI